MLQTSWVQYLFIDAKNHIQTQIITVLFVMIRDFYSCGCMSWDILYTRSNTQTLNYYKKGVTEHMSKPYFLALTYFYCFHMIQIIKTYEKDTSWFIILQFHIQGYS
jgi:hypothetical protein